MIIGTRLRELREQKNLSQGDIQKRTGLLRCYISRVENGHTVPSVETLEKIAHGLEVPLYRLFYDGEQPPAFSNLRKRRSGAEVAWGTSGPDASVLKRFRQCLKRMNEDDLGVLLSTARRMAKPKGA